MLKPHGQWDGKDHDFEFTVHELSDVEHAVDEDTRHSVGSQSTFLNGTPVVGQSKMQGCVTLSVTEVELVSGCDCAQDMLCFMRLLESIRLKVKKPLVLWMDNKGAVDLASSWTVALRTCHVATKVTFLRDLEEAGILHCKWMSNTNMSSDINTKNVGGVDFHRHSSACVG
jgi:hypothetical protein